MRANNGKYLLLPALISVALFTFYPIIQIALPTIKDFSTFKDLYGSFFTSTYNVRVLGRTFLIAVITTFIVLLIGLPVSLWIARQKKNLRQVLSILILFPMLTNAVVRNFAWIIILGRDGIVNKLLMAIGIISKPASILYTNTSIVIGSVYLFLPIMITSLIGSISELNIEVEEAAAVLGSNPFSTLIRVILPQLTTGLLTGAILVFAGTMTAYTTPQILGGNKHLVMSTLIYQQAMTLGNWNSASAIALILILVSALSMILMKKGVKLLDRRPDNAN
ncbi:ABC transporter permease [Lactobacillus corticis]|uniref:Spermidine/putrescine ABC transporter permease protein n=1 Tax=Lactobacillus corticis TaxID=2201249 RepID=A0A916VIQ4_9LACO|nr:ABC transporter permease [Lactobacillus corticis]GFZ26159.1 spermidine/putrescine ABC transporter permease protein [Lactobacillus corticis]